MPVLGSKIKSGPEKPWSCIAVTRPITIFNDRGRSQRREEWKEREGKVSARGRKEERERERERGRERERERERANHSIASVETAAIVHAENTEEALANKRAGGGDLDCGK